MSEGRVACVGSYQKCCASEASLSLLPQTESEAYHLNGATVVESLALANTAKSKDTDADQSTEVINRTDDQKETSAIGVVKWDTVVGYCRAMPGGLLSGLLLLVLFILAQSSAVACVAVIGKWATLSDQQNVSVTVTVVGLTSAVILLATMRAVLYFRLTIKASERLHADMTSAVLGARIGWFDSNPLVGDALVLFLFSSMSAHNVFHHLTLFRRGES